MALKIEYKGEEQSLSSAIFKSIKDQWTDMANKKLSHLLPEIEKNNVTIIVDIGESAIGVSKNCPDDLREKIRKALSS